MIDHTGVEVSDPVKSRRFYDMALAPLGFRAPSADLSESTLELVEERGFLYDSSLMADDYRPFRPRIGDRVARGHVHHVPAGIR